MRFGKFTAIMLGWAMGFAVSNAWAHHSAAPYDLSKTETVTGTIKELFWGAPHASMTVSYIGPDGTPKEVWVGTAAPAVLVRQGFTSKDLHVGDRVTLAWHPDKSGALGGLMSSLTLPDGRVIHGDSFGPGGTPLPPGPPPAAPSVSQ
jgi:hypothetical protein